MSLTPAEIKTFQDHGFLLVRQLASQDQIEAVQVECRDVHARMRNEPPAGVHISWEDEETRELIRQLMHSELVSPTLNSLLRSARVLDIVQDLIGPDISLFHCKLLPKSKGSGAEVPWHQDFAYWRQDTNQPLMVNCMLAIHPADLENGCIEFIPGSHKWGLQEHERHQEAFGMFLPGRYYPRPEAEAVPMAAGDALFFTSLVIHGSAPNQSARDRWANTIAYNVTGNGEGQDREALRTRETAVSAPQQAAPAVAPSCDCCDCEC